MDARRSDAVITADARRGGTFMFLPVPTVRTATMWLKKLIILGIALNISTSEALRFLVVFPMIARSHTILGRGVSRHLLEAGHEVVHISSYPQEKNVTNLTEINVAHFSAKIREERSNEKTYSVQHLVGKRNIVDKPDFFYFPLNLHKQFLEDKVIVNFLSDPKQHFDAVIVEWFFSDLFAGLAPLFNCPLIYVCSTEPHWQILRIVGDVPNPAYTTVSIFSTRGVPTTLWDRICELFTLVEKYFHTVVKFGSLERNLYNVVYPPIAANRGVSMPSFEDAAFNASLIFMNTHPSISWGYNLPQNVKLIGGFHIDDAISTTPTDLKKLMDEAKNGLIYFSLGSNIKSSLMSDKMKRSLLEAFSKLKQLVIWKFETDEMENVPSNVHLSKWAPQQNILAHPNLKIFITHGGRLSNLEAISYGVPMIVVPMFADQFVNAKIIAGKGFGIDILLTENLADDILHAVRKMLSDPTYKTKAKEASMIYHHRLVPPGAELVYWVEHVVKTGGGHLRSPGARVPAYQKMYIDVLAVLIILGVSIIIVYRRWKKRFAVRKYKIS